MPFSSLEIQNIVSYSILDSKIKYKYDLEVKIVAIVIFRIVKVYGIAI